MALIKSYKGSISDSKGCVSGYAKWRNDISPAMSVILPNKDTLEKEAAFSVKKFLANKKAKAFKKYFDSTAIEDKYESKVIKLIGINNFKFISCAGGARKFRYTEESACSIIQIYKTLELFNLI